MVILHIVLKRAFPRKSLISTYFTAFFISVFLFVSSNAVYMYLKSLSFNYFMPVFAANLIILICADYCYINTVNVVNASVRIRILDEISGSVSGLSERQILRIYNAGSILASRLERLLGSGQIIKRSGKYISGKSGQILLSMFFMLFRTIIFGNMFKTIVKKEADFVKKD
jgi:hypothetical protein